MIILVTGSNGQLGSEIRELAPAYSDYLFHFTDQDTLDVSDADKVLKYIKKNHIQAVINCAAFTSVDLAEDNKPAAMQANSIGAKNLAEASAKAGALLIHLSTDYVFEGKMHRPYTENDTALPKTIYGKTKLEGEIEVIFNAKQALIIRTSWLYSSHGHNFVKTILKKAAEEKEIRVVYDQISSPTYAGDLATAILDIIPRVPKRLRAEVYNYSNEGVASWYDLAKAIVEIKGLDCRVVPILSKEIQTPAIRPHYTLLHKGRIKNDFGLSIPYWRDSLEKCLEKL